METKLSKRANSIQRELVNKGVGDWKTKCVEKNTFVISRTLRYEKGITPILDTPFAAISFNKDISESEAAFTTLLMTHSQEMFTILTSMCKVIELKNLQDDPGFMMNYDAFKTFIVENFADGLVTE